MHKRTMLSSLYQNIDTFVYRWYNCVKQEAQDSSSIHCVLCPEKIIAEDV